MYTWYPLHYGDQMLTRILIPVVFDLVGTLFWSSWGNKLKSQNYLFFSAESVVWRVGLANRYYSLYSIKTIRSMECPHKTWKPNVCVCDLECAEVGMKILWYNVDTPSQKWATAACRRSWFQDSHTHTHTHAHKIHSQWYLVLCNNIKTVTPVSPVLCEERF